MYMIMYIGHVALDSCIVAAAGCGCGQMAKAPGQHYSLNGMWLLYPVLPPAAGSGCGGGAGVPSAA